jgi:alanyl-tRNA synthetase
VVKAIYTGSEFVDSVNTDGDVGVILESTSFYAEQGGQVFGIINILYMFFCMLILFALI